MSLFANITIISCFLFRNISPRSSISKHLMFAIISGRLLLPKGSSLNRCTACAVAAVRTPPPPSAPFIARKTHADPKKVNPP